MPIDQKSERQKHRDTQQVSSMKRATVLLLNNNYIIYIYIHIIVVTNKHLIEVCMDIQ